MSEITHAKFSVSNKGKGVGGNSICLKIASRGLSKMKIHLCKDIFGNSCIFETDMLRFSLCTEDIAAIFLHVIMFKYFYMS